jgi:hypothetical protein
VGPGSQPGAVLILDDDSTQVSASAILSAAGFDVTQGGHYWDYTGTNFSAYDLVILLDGYDYGNSVPDSVQQGLLDFVSAGGVLLTTEWLTYDDDLSLILPALPLAYDGDYCDSGAGTCPETYTKVATHAITAGLPASFVTPADWTYSYTSLNASSTSTNVKVLFTGSTSGDALAIGDRGSGHIIHWNMAGVYGGADIWDSNTQKILTNIADFAH